MKNWKKSQLLAEWWEDEFGCEQGLRHMQDIKERCQEGSGIDGSVMVSGIQCTNEAICLRSSLGSLNTQS